MLLYCLASLLATSLMDAEMSAEELQQTGLSKLTVEEKTALEDWVDSRYAKKEIAQTLKSKKQASKPASLQDNLQGGHYIRLTDGTLWEIRPTDTPISAGWITQVEIKMGQSGDPSYPVSLTNSLTGSTVWARKATSVPPAKPIPKQPQ
jgi:hypothetical protein